MLTAKPRIYIDIVNSDIGVTVTRNGGFKCELQKKMDAYCVFNADLESKLKKKGSTFFRRLYSSPFINK